MSRLPPGSPAQKTTLPCSRPCWICKTSKVVEFTWSCSVSLGRASIRPPPKATVGRLPAPGWRATYDGACSGGAARSKCRADWSLQMATDPLKSGSAGPWPAASRTPASARSQRRRSGQFGSGSPLGSDDGGRQDAGS